MSQKSPSETFLTGGLVCYITYPMTKKKHSKGAAALKRQRARIVGRVPVLEQMLRGSLVERYKKCGKPGCHCVNGRGHGPAYYLSVTLAPGKTRSYYVPARLREQVARYLRNYQEFRELGEEITRINRELLVRGAFEEED